MRVPGCGDFGARWGFWRKILAGGGWRPARLPRPFSQDLPDRVVAAVSGGCSRRATARIFSVSLATGVRWSQRFATGSAAALAVGGRRPHPLAGRGDWLLARIAEQPDPSLRALLAGLAADGVRVSHGALWACFAREGITVKKSACTPANRAAPISPAGASGGGHIRAGLTPSGWSLSMRPRIDATPDRCDPGSKRPRPAPGQAGARPNMTRRHGRCARGTRLIAKVPHGRWMAAGWPLARPDPRLRGGRLFWRPCCDRITAPGVLDGPINRASWRAYVEQFLVPTLSPRADPESSCRP